MSWQPERRAFVSSVPRRVPVKSYNEFYQRPDPADEGEGVDRAENRGSKGNIFHLAREMPLSAKLFQACLTL